MGCLLCNAELVIYVAENLSVFTTYTFSNKCETVKRTISLRGFQLWFAQNFRRGTTNVHNGVSTCGNAQARTKPYRRIRYAAVQLLTSTSSGIDSIVGG